MTGNFGNEITAEISHQTPTTPLITAHNRYAERAFSPETPTRTPLTSKRKQQITTPDAVARQESELQSYIQPLPSPPPLPKKATWITTNANKVKNFKSMNAADRRAEITKLRQEIEKWKNSPDKKSKREILLKQYETEHEKLAFLENNNNNNSSSTSSSTPSSTATSTPTKTIPFTPFTGGSCQ